MTRKAGAKKGDKYAESLDLKNRTIYVAGNDNKLPDPNDHVIIHLNTEPSANIPEPATSAMIDAYNNHGTDFSYLSGNSGSTFDNKLSDSLDLNINPRTVVLLEEFCKKTDTGEWPCNTSVHCHWCCHPFDGTPVSLPIKMTMTADSTDIQKCETIGCFCSFQCAAAYNFDRCNDSDDMWERYAMLNRLYFEYQLDNGVSPNVINRILPAPCKYVLTMFGGHMNITEFRACSMPKEYVQHNDETCTKAGTFVDVLKIPMTHIPQHVEEVNEIDVMQPLKFIPVDQDRINRVKEKLQLRRTKPLLDSRNTLDQVMNLTISSTD